MGRLFIPVENQVDGPWLLGHENLETLNSLFGEIDKKLNKALTRTIEYTAKQQGEEEGQTLDMQKRVAKLQRKYNQKMKFAEITFSDGTTYKADDIEGVLNYVDTNPTLTPIELYIRTIQGNSENEFDLIINTKPDKESATFEYRIKCLDESIQQKIKSLIDRWIRENKSHWLLQLWSNILVYIIWFIGGFILIITGPNITETVSKANSYQVQIKQQAQKMIERGISKNNSDSALLLVLKLQSDYIPDNVKAETKQVRNDDIWKIFVITAIIFCVSLIRPKTILGIGKKYNRLKLYKTWIHITYSILAALFIAIITDSFIHFINWSGS